MLKLIYDGQTLPLDECDENSELMRALATGKAPGITSVISRNRVHWVNLGEGVPFTVATWGKESAVPLGVDSHPVGQDPF